MPVNAVKPGSEHANDSYNDIPLAVVVEHEAGRGSRTWTALTGMLICSASPCVLPMDELGKADAQGKSIT
jgi:hypothetical protein